MTKIVLLDNLGTTEPLVYMYVRPAKSGGGKRTVT